MANPSFDFKWDIKKQNTSAKVFSRSRPLKTTTNTVSDGSQPDNNFDKSSNDQNEDSDIVAIAGVSSSETKQEVEAATLVPSEQTRFVGKDKNKSFKNNTDYRRERRRAGKAVTEKLFTSNKSFRDLNEIHDHIISNLEKHNFLRLTTVQEKAIPIVVEGKNVLVRNFLFRNIPRTPYSC